MTKNRIKPLSHPLKEDLQNDMDKIFPLPIPSPNLFRILAKNEALFKELVETRFIGRSGLFDRKRLSPVIREKIILRVCVAAKNDYEFALHAETISEMMGLSPEQIQDIKNQKLSPELWKHADLALFDLIDTLINKKTVTDEIFDEVSTFFNEDELIDIVFLIGLYNGVAMIVALTKPEEDGYKKYLKPNSE